MIQRIQSLYLLLVAVLTGLMLLMPLGTFLGGTEEMYLDGTPVLTAYGLAATVIAAALLPFVTIFLYKKRLLQFRLCVVETVLLAGVMLFEIYYIWGGARSLSTLAVSAWKLSAAAFFPPVSLIFTYLALRGIRKDILLVKSLDTIR